MWGSGETEVKASSPPRRKKAGSVGKTFDPVPCSMLFRSGGTAWNRVELTGVSHPCSLQSSFNTGTQRFLFRFVPPCVPPELILSQRLEAPGVAALHPPLVSGSNPFRTWPRALPAGRGQWSARPQYPVSKLSRSLPSFPWPSARSRRDSTRRCRPRSVSP